jgi:Zn-dependent metalloprotease
MQHFYRFARSIHAIVISFVFLFSATQPVAATTPLQDKDGEIRRSYHFETGKLTFLGADPSRPITVRAAQSQGFAPEQRAMAMVEAYAGEFGLKSPREELHLKSERMAGNREVTRYQQTYQGIPVIGGELIVNATDTGGLLSINGEISPDLSLDTTPTIQAGLAEQTALQSLAKWYDRPVSDFVATKPELWVYDSRLLQVDGNSPVLVWRMEVSPTDGLTPIRELVLVDAHRGNIPLHFNQVDTAWHIQDDRPMLDPTRSTGSGAVFESSGLAALAPIVRTYTAGGTFSLPGTFLCDQTQPNCTNGANTDADAAHRYTIGTYNFYATHHNRDSFDNNGSAIVSSVDFGINYANAFWDGSQMVYGDGYPVADDVVAHELTHGVTQFESNLFYYYQSGAINESFSDIWGELYDQSNRQGTDTPAVKWLIGEDVPGGVLRSMSNPPAYGDPDAITSPNYYLQAGDNGGVHYNSGVNNKAAYLMVDGGTFNSKTVTALGADKTLAIYYEVQTNLLTTGSDYADLYNVLYQACLNLIGSNGITSADCQGVRDATDAVAMNAQPSSDPSFNPDAPPCAIGSPVGIPLFSDNLEAGMGKWTTGILTGTGPRWQYNSIYGSFAHSGTNSLYADDFDNLDGDFYYDGPIDAFVRMTNSVTVTPGTTMLFHHAYGFEDEPGYFYDGGVLEYSIDNGGTWFDAGALINFNSYDNVIYTLSDPANRNPLAGRSAFVGDSHGYISTRVDLRPLSGRNVMFRWRMGLDQFAYDMGWWLDDVQIYRCRPSFLDVPSSYWAYQYVEALFDAGVTVGCGLGNYCAETFVTRDQIAVFLLRGIHGSTYAPPAVGDTTGFADVPINHWAAAWIKQFATEGITSGCGNSNYCPQASVTRDQMAIFLLRAKYGAAYTPPPVATTTGFGDVPTNYWAAAWIKQLAAEGITNGCGNGNFCPDAPVSRAQMAIFLTRTFNLPLP